MPLVCLLPILLFYHLSCMLWWGPEHATVGDKIPVSPTIGKFTMAKIREQNGRYMGTRGDCQVSTLNVRLPAATVAAIKAKASADGAAINRLVEELLTDALFNKTVKIPCFRF